LNVAAAKALAGYDDARPDRVAASENQAREPTEEAR
jgi:hypothetical protein